MFTVDVKQQSNKATKQAITYWLKVITSENDKYINYIYKLMIDDIDSNSRKATGHLAKKIIGSLAFIEFGYIKVFVITMYY